MLSRGHKLYQGKKPIVREAAILASCRQMLNLMRGAGHLHYVRVSGGPIMRGGPGKAIFSKNHDMAGFSDLIIWVRGGPVVCVELKAEDGELSDDQKAFGERLRRIGHHYQVVRSVAELEDLLVAHGVPRLTLLPSKG